MSIDEVIEQAVERAVSRQLGAIHADVKALLRAQPPKFLTITEAAEAMGVCNRTVERMIEAGQLVYKRVGKTGRGIRIDASSIHADDEVGARRAAGGRRG